MLDLMRRYAYSWATRVILGLIILVFVFWGVGTGLFATVHPIATVNGHRILAEQVDHRVAKIEQNLQTMYGPKALKLFKQINLRQEVLDSLIDEQVINAEAQRIGIHISKAELQQKIASQRAFQVDGQFDFQRYRAELRAHGMAPKDYETAMRTQMVQNVLKQMVEHAVNVSESEARHTYDLRNETLSVAYIEIPYSNFTGKISPTAEQVKKYYEANRDSFREPAKIKIAYIHYQPSVLAATFNPTDKQIDRFYKDNLKSRFTHREEADASHILIQAAPNASAKLQQQAKAKAEKILEQLKKGANFAELARKYSQDPGTKDQGGELGYFTRDEMVKAFSDAVFSMKPGQIRIVRSVYGYHVVKLNSIKPAHTETLAEAKPQIIAIIRDQQGKRMARNALDQDISAALSGDSLSKIASKRGLKVVDTPFFSLDETAAFVSDPKVAQVAMKLEKGHTRAVMNHGAPYLVKLLDRRPPHVPPLKDIQTTVRAALIHSEATQQANADAVKLLKQMKGPGGFQKVAESNNLKVHKTNPFARSSQSVAGIGNFPTMIDAAAMLPMVPGVIGRVMQQGGNSYIFQVMTRAVPTDKEWASAKHGFMKQYVAERRQHAWAQFVDALKARATIMIDTSQLGGQGTASSS